MKKRNIKKTIAISLALVSMFTVTALASSGSTRIYSNDVYYYNTPSRGSGNAVTEWNTQRSSIRLYVKLERADYNSDRTGSIYTEVGATSDPVAAGVGVDAAPTNGWSSTHEVWENYHTIFHDGLWANRK